MTRIDERAEPAYIDNQSAEYIVAMEIGMDFYSNELGGAMGQMKSVRRCAKRQAILGKVFQRFEPYQPSRDCGGRSIE